MANAPKAAKAAKPKADAAPVVRPADRSPAEAPFRQCRSMPRPGAPAEGVEPAVDDTRVRFAQLFTHLNIIKIIFVDDKAEPQTDAGTVIQVLAANEAAKEPLDDFFPGVALTLENDALQEQLTARLGELDAERLAALRGVLAAQSGDAAEREALGRLQDLLPDATTAHLLTPHAWHERRTALIDQCTEASRTLFLFDQELDLLYVSPGFTKGSEIIRDMAEKEKAAFGTRWFCAMLTHTVEKGDEVTSWRRLAKSENLDLRFFMPIAKTTLDDAPAFYGAVYRTLINTYCQTMKSLAQDAFEQR